MTFLSQTKAAKLAGISRGTISNRIHEGRLSQTPDGIDLAEMVRVFPHITSDRIEQFLAGEDAPLTVNNPANDGPVEAAAATPNGYLEKRLKEADRNAEWLRELNNN